jgi:diguanylate cyclase (GGDEF)-like protein
MRSLMSLQSLLGASTLVASLCVALCVPFAAAWQGYASAATELAVSARIDATPPAAPRPAPAPGATGIDASIRWEIVDAGGLSLGHGDPLLEWPVIERTTTFPLPRYGMVELRLAKSLRPLVDDVALLTLVCSVVGLAVGLFMRRVVLRLLDHVLSEQRAQNLRFTTAIENISQGLCFFDGNQRLIVANRRYAEMYGLPDTVVRPGTMLRDIVDARFAIGSFPEMNRDEYLARRDKIAISNKPWDTKLALRNGKTFTIHHEPMPDGGWVATHEDITTQTQALAQIERMAHHDSLTGLPNRVRFRERLDTAIQEASPGASLALLYIDLDRFKVVNDTLGHPIGDELLRLVAQRLHDCLRQGDLLARLGGDEFAIIQMDASQPVAAESLASRLVQVMERPFDVEGHRLVAATSVGVALWPADGLDSDQLLSQADLALYDAKAAGRGTYRFFHAQMREKANSRRALEIDLRRAVALGQLELHYQPIVSLRHPSGRPQRRVAAFEALLRWRHPELGMVMPDLFIGLAEETGLIEPIGEWVLEQAMTEALAWPADIGVAVNLSPQQLKGDRLVDVVRQALRRSGLAPERVELEITESVLLVENQVNVAQLHELRALGVKISLDDFGTGYSSLSYLRSFPFEKIKIDRSFVHDVAVNKEAAAIVSAIATLADTLDMVVTAEGVETEEQLTSLMQLRCQQAQGFLFSKPRPASEVAEMLRTDRRLVLVG